MKLSTYEEFINHHKTWNEEKREITIKNFPYTAIVEGYYPELDYSHRWCWRQFGSPQYKECSDYGSEYPACPLVLAIEEYIIKKSYTDKDGTVHEYDFHTRDPGKHGHDGCWTTVWLGKTDYDYGFSEYCFASEKDRDTFVVEVPKFGLGENYED